MPFRIYLPKRRKNGKVVQGSSYRARIKLPGAAKGIDIALGVTDEKAASAMAGARLKEMEQESAGVLAPKAMREASSKDLLQFLPEFIRSRETVGRNDRYMGQVESHCRKIINSCGWRNVRDVNAASFERWRSGMRKAGKTLNEYLNSINVFLDWMMKMGCVAENRLDNVERVDTRRDEKRLRLAFTKEEFLKLLGVVPQYRAWLYTVAVCTGLRRSELRDLQWRDVQLGSDPTITVRASIAKNARRETRRLHPEAAKVLEAMKPPEAAPLDRVFRGGIPEMDTFKRDLAKAGIPYVDDQGRVLDFHSLRKTCATWMLANGAAPMAVKELMRHSDLKLTTDTYTDRAQLPLQEALSKIHFQADSLPDSLSYQIPPLKLTQELLEELGEDGLQCIETDPDKYLLGMQLLRGTAWKNVSPSGVEPCETPCEIKGSSAMTPSQTPKLLQLAEEFTEVARAWGKLPDMLKAAILAIVRTHMQSCCVDSTKIVKA